MRSRGGRLGDDQSHIGRSQPQGKDHTCDSINILPRYSTHIGPQFILLIYFSPLPRFARIKKHPPKTPHLIIICAGTGAHVALRWGTFLLVRNRQLAKRLAFARRELRFLTSRPTRQIDSYVDDSTPKKIMNFNGKGRALTSVSSGYDYCAHRNRFYSSVCELRGARRGVGHNPSLDGEEA